MTKTPNPPGDTPAENASPPAADVELERPRSGGSYVRQKDGSLKPKED